MANENIFDGIESIDDSQLEKELNKDLDIDTNNSSEKLPESSNEIDLDNLSDRAVGDVKKYERENLDGKEVKIKSAKLFAPDRQNDEVISAMSDPNKKYYKTKFVVTYDLKNKDGIEHREFYSGVIQHVQKDNSLSQPSIWYEGSESQAALLWEAVAKKKTIDPKELSPREFMNFLNSGPKCILHMVEAKFGKGANAVKVQKNLVKEFL